MEGLFKSHQGIAVQIDLYIILYVCRHLVSKLNTNCKHKNRVVLTKKHNVQDNMNYAKLTAPLWRISFASGLEMERAYSTILGPTRGTITR